MDLHSVLKGLVHNSTFYFSNDPMAVFLVENQLFRVHRHFLIEGSEVFRDMFTHAGSNSPVEGATEGTTDDWPIPLPNVTIHEFEVLLRCLYKNRTMRLTLRITLHDQKEKLALLSIAHRFNFSSIFQNTIKQISIDKMSVLDRIRLGDKYDMDEWLLSAYIDIIDRAPDVKWNEGEAEALGLERVNRLLQAENSMLHERLRILEKSTDPNHNPTPNLSGVRNQRRLRGTTSTEEIVRKYFPENQAASREYGW